MRLETKAPALRIVMQRSASGIDIVAQCPTDNTQQVLAEGLDKGTIRDVNKFLWHQFNKIIESIETDPNIKDAGTLAFRIFRLGESALLTLAGEGNEDMLDLAKQFCMDRIPRGSGNQDGVPVLEVVDLPGVHLPFEVLPLLGRMDPDLTDHQQLDQFRNVMPGLATVCVHGAMSPPGSGTLQGYRMGVNIFRYYGLEGAVFDEHYLASLTDRRFKVEAVWPPKGYEPPPDFPELELVRAVTQSRNAGKGVDRYIPMAHFTCHVSQEDKQTYLKLRRPGKWGGGKDVRFKLHEIDAASRYVDQPPPSPPLVFLSACRSGAVDEFTFTSAANSLARLKPMALVGALADLPGIMAAEFAKAFYTALKSKSVGESVLDARHALLGKPYSNPLGLMIVSYFGESMQFEGNRRIPPTTHTAL